MKIFINTYNRQYSISTHLLLDKCGIEYKIVLHDLEQYNLYVQNSSIKKECLLVANQPVGMVGIRSWILENLVKDGEWYLLLDDNISCFEAVKEPFYQESILNVKGNPAFYKPIFENEVDATMFLKICEDSIKEAERIGAKLVGFASNVNFFFREKKFRDVGYVIGKTQLIKKTNLKYDRNVFATDDYLWTAQNLETFGKVLVNNYAVAVKKHYAKGGIGLYEDRLKWKLTEVDYFMRRFPGLFRFKIKKGCHPKAEIQLAFTKNKQVEKWRAFMRTKRS